MAGRKRVYAGRPGGRMFKKRRFSKRRIIRRRRGGGRVSTYNSLSTRGTNWGFKSRKISRRAWNKKLWDSTLQSTHYRSAETVLDTNASTPDSGLDARSVIFQAIDNGARFWTAAGGAIDVDGGTVPVFDGDIILRGGTLSIVIGSNDATVTVGNNYRGTLMLVKSTKDFDTSGFNSTTRPATWDPTMFPEFETRIGRIILRREFFLAANDQTLRINARIPIQKIDQESWLDGIGRYYWILICNSPLADGSANAGVTAIVNIGWNLSFSGDAIGTT